MVKYNLNDLFSDLDSESSLIQKSIKIRDTISNNTSSDIPQKGGYLESYSSSFMPQKKEHFTSSNKKNKNINLMKIQYDAATSDNYTTNYTDTEQLKNKLLNILKYGGSPPELAHDPAYAQNYDPSFDPATNTEHTDIIYTCCLIDLNLVKKLAQSIKENPMKTTRIYININPFNIWGSAIQGIAFGEHFYKARRYLHELFIEGGLLDNSFPVSPDDTYETSIAFIKYLQTKNIIIFDSPDYKIKPFLYSKEESIPEILTLIEISPLLKNQEDKEKLKTFVLEEEKKYLLTKKDSEMKMTLPYEWYRTHLPEVGFAQALENFGLKKIEKTTYPGKLSKIKLMVRDYKTKYIQKFTQTADLTDPIRSIEHNRVILELIDLHFPIGPKDPKDPKDPKEPEETEDSLLNKVLKILLKESSHEKMKKKFIGDTSKITIEESKETITCEEYVNRLDGAILQHIPKWFSVYYFSMFGPKLFHDFSGLLFICRNLSNEDILKPYHPKNKIFDGEKLQMDIIERCKTLKENDKKEGKNIEKMHNGYIVDIINQITNVHTKLQNFTIIADMEGDDASAVFGAHFFFPEHIKLYVTIQQSTSLKNPSLVLYEKASFKEKVLQEFCENNGLESSLLTVHYMIELLMENFTKTYTKRTKYDYINIDYLSRTKKIRQLFTQEEKDIIKYEIIKNKIIEKEIQEKKIQELQEKELQEKELQKIKDTIAHLEIINNLATKVEKDTEHFEFFEGIKQKIIPGISPNICKVAELLLEMCKPDKVKTAKLVNYIKTMTVEDLRIQRDKTHQKILQLTKDIQLTDTQPTEITRKYLKKNIY